MIIAIDGPAGAGKSSVAREVARVLGLTYLDTGAMYRAVTLSALEQGIYPSSGEECGRLASELDLAFDQHGGIQIDGRPGEPAIRGAQVTAAVSAVSAHPEVRRAVVARQRALASGAGLVAEGRDTTTVVFPGADHKFFLTASPPERARRRARQLDRPADVAGILEGIEQRDGLDSSRAHSPLLQAPDAVVIETDGLDLSQVVERVLAEVRRGRPDGRPRAPGAGSEVAPRRSVPEVIVHCTLAYRLGRFASRVVWGLLFRPRMEGREGLPKAGGALLCANHQSLLDIPLLAHLTARHVSFVARDSLARLRPLSWLMRRSGVVLVRRGLADRAALREMVAHLTRGDLLAVFPEGTRSADGSLGPFRAGALLAARQAGVPVVPIGIRGAFEAWPRGARLPRLRRISARVGQAVDPHSPGAIEAVRAQIAAMIGDGRFAARPAGP